MHFYKKLSTCQFSHFEVRSIGTQLLCCCGYSNSSVSCAYESTYLHRHIETNKQGVQVEQLLKRKVNEVGRSEC